MQIGIYARVSTKDQSCEMQLRDLRTYCAARGFRLVNEYNDVGQSCAKDSRPELNKLMDNARKRQFDAIVVWRFDRFARSTKHLLLELEEFRSLGIQFISYQENIDTSRALGQALFMIVSAVAQLERDLIRERVSAGIRNARANGKKLGRPMRVVDREGQDSANESGRPEPGTDRRKTWSRLWDCPRKAPSGVAEDPTQNLPANTSI
jgi:DNA invertase Pin-like site-specific DNA recombinase